MLRSHPQLGNTLIRTLILVALSAGFAEGCKHSLNAKDRRAIASALRGVPKEVPPAAEPPVPPPAPAPGPADFPTTGINYEEKLKNTENILYEMRIALKRIADIIAKGKDDIVILKCVSEKLIQAKGLLKISEQAIVKISEALATNEPDKVNHEFTKMTIAHQKVFILLAEAEQCVEK